MTIVGLRECPAKSATDWTNLQRGLGRCSAIVVNKTLPWRAGLRYISLFVWKSFQAGRGRAASGVGKAEHPEMRFPLSLRLDRKTRRVKRP